MDRDADGVAVMLDFPVNRLADPPNRVSREGIAAGYIKKPQGPQEAEVAGGFQFLQIQRVSVDPNILSGILRDELLILTEELVFRFFIP